MSHGISQYDRFEMIRLVLAGFGAFLLTVNVLGFWLTPSISVGEIQSAKTVPGYYSAVRNRQLLTEYLTKPVANFDLNEVNQVVFESMRHARHSLEFYENWFMWTLGRFYSSLAQTNDPHRIVDSGVGTCSDVAIVLHHIAQLNGQQARFIGLSGHVVLEVESNSGWQVADPDFGVVFDADLAALENPASTAMIKTALADNGFDAQVVDSYAQLYQTSHDNLVWPIDTEFRPQYRWYEWASGLIKWIFPIALMLLLYRRRVQEVALDR